MENNVLNTVKITNGIVSECNEFDSILLIYINSVFMELKQLGALNRDVVCNEYTDWMDIVTNLGSIQSIVAYTGLKVKLMFDPPTNGTVSKSLEQTLTELAYRLTTQAEIENKLD